MIRHEKKSFIPTLLAGLLALGLTACGPVLEMPSPSPIVPPEASTPVSKEPSPLSDTPEPVLEDSLPDREYGPLQRAYI